MGGWRIFWNVASTSTGAERGGVVTLESRTFISENEAKRLVRQLMSDGHAVISLRRPDSSRIVKGDELRAWVYKSF